MEKYYVYLHINKINNKVYVGITKKVPEDRWKRGYKFNPHFSNAILKYGWSNFEHIVLFSNLEKRVACRLEVLLIKRYRRNNRCYNISDGGESPSSTMEVRLKISKALKGKPKSEEHKRKCGLANLGNHFKRSKESVAKAVQTRKLRNNYKRPTWLWNRNVSGINSPMYGKHLSEEALMKKYKPVIMYNKAGNFIREFKSIKEASEYIGVGSSQIAAACRGRAKTAAKFIWKYK